MKAILILDMPRCCVECIAFDFATHCCFAVSGDEVAEKCYEKRQSWCPLKPLPEKKGHMNCEGCNSIECEYAEGFNACIDELEGKDE